jgi:hypothetical protein
VQPHIGSDILRTAAAWAVCQASACSRAYRELAGIRSCLSSCFKWDSRVWIGRNGWERDIVRVDRRSSVAANMTEMPEARLGWALEDTQHVSIMLSSPNLIGPFSGGPGAFWKAAPHPAGRTRKGERRPAAEVAKKLLFSGS